MNKLYIDNADRKTFEEALKYLRMALDTFGELSDEGYAVMQELIGSDDTLYNLDDAIGDVDFILSETDTLD